MKKQILLLLTILNSYWAYGQVCGTPPPEQIIIYPENANARGASSAFCVDIFFHIVRNTDGTNAFTTTNLDDIVSNLNEFFTPRNIILNNAGSDFIDSTKFVITSESETVALTNINNHADAINYYIVSELWDLPRDFFVAGLAMSTPSNKIIMRNDRVLTSTSQHELGHCFNLHHTFLGSPAEPRNNTCAEAINNGTNCVSCGDLVCDTPADQDRGASFGYSPDMTNIMSYYRPRDHFTIGQGRRMRSAISQEDILQNVTGNSCVNISEVNNVCPSETTVITLTNLGGATTTWTSSANVVIDFSDDFEATLIAIDNNAFGDGWVTATLSNGIILTEEFEVGTISLAPYYIANASLQGSTVNINNEVWNYVDVWSDTQLANVFRYHWNITATGSAVRHIDGQNLGMVRPNQNWGNIQIGIQVENACGTTPWKWRTFNVNGTSGGGRPGQIFPE